MIKNVFIFALFVLANSVNAQNKDAGIGFLSEKVLIKSIEYPISVSNRKIILRGNGISVRKVINKGNSYIIKATYAKEYYIDLFEVRNNDTTFMKREHFDVVSMPKPKFTWGKLDSYSWENIELTKDSLMRQTHIFLTSGWHDSRNHQWKIVGAEVQFKGKAFIINDAIISSEVLQKIATCNQETPITFILTYVGPDDIRKKLSVLKTIKVISDEVVEEKTTLEVISQNEANFQVVSIGSERFLGKNYSDTLRIKKNSKLFLRFHAPGSENNFTISSREYGMILKVELWTNDDELYDFSNDYGLFEIELDGDGGMGKMIMIIE
ncbi:MAG: hypothetical protein COA33_008035 [Fluviicola sp.]|nr:hypothetical protein [Fluviicola sp.]